MVQNRERQPHNQLRLFVLLPTPMQIQFKKTIINSQLNSKRQKGAPLWFLDCHPINFATQLISKILTRIRDYWERDKERERGAMKGS